MPGPTRGQDQRRQRQHRPHGLYYQSFMNATGTRLTPVNYKGGGQASPTWSPAASRRPWRPERHASLHQGRQAEGPCHRRRQAQPALPDVPTFAEAGVKTTTNNWIALFAPSKTPRDIIDKMNAQVRGPGNARGGRRAGQAGSCARIRSACRGRALIRTEADRFGKAIKDSGLKVEILRRCRTISDAWTKPGWTRSGKRPSIPPSPSSMLHHHMWWRNPVWLSLIIDDLARTRLPATTSSPRSSSTSRPLSQRRAGASGAGRAKPNGSSARRGLCPRASQGPALAPGIMGHVNLRRDPALVDEALQAHKAASAASAAFARAGPGPTTPRSIRAARRLAAPYVDPAFREGFARLAKHGLSSTPGSSMTRCPSSSTGAGLSRHAHRLRPPGRAAGQGRWANQQETVFRGLEAEHPRTGALPNVHMKLCGSAMPMFGFDWGNAPCRPRSDEMVAAAGHFYDTRSRLSRRRAACSRATSRSTSWPAATCRCGTASRRWPRATALPNRPTCCATPPGASTGWIREDLVPGGKSPG